MRSWQRTQCNPSYSSWYLKQTAKVKSSVSGCLMSCLEISKTCHFEVLSSLILCNNNEPFLNWIVMCDGKWTVYDNRLSGWTEKLQSTSQSQTCTKKSRSLFGCLLPVWSTTTFWILVKPFHLRSMLSRSIRCNENCNACTLHQSAERTQFSTTTPNHTLHNQHFKSWTNWATKFCRIHHIHLTSCQPTTTFSSILTTFCKENVSSASRMQKTLSKSLLNPKAWIFMLQE